MRDTTHDAIPNQYFLVSGEKFPLKGLTVK